MRWRRVWLHLFLGTCLLYGGRVYAADNTQLLEAALQTVHEEFLTPVSYDIYSSWAVQALNQYDKKLKVVDDESRITLYYNSQIFRSYLKPQGRKSEKPKAWAKFMLKVLDAAKEISPAVKQKDFEAPDKMLQFATQNLDPYSKYISVLVPEKKQDFRLVNDFGVNLTSEDILYVKLSDITKFTSRNFEAALKRYGQVAKALIIDLRGCHGGALQGAIEVADLFLPNGIIASTHGRKDNSVVFYEAHPDVLFAGKPIVVLVDKGTASSAEILVAALQEQSAAIIMGTGTFGKGSVQNVVSLPDNNKMILTNAYAFTPAGNPIHKYGLIPDVCLYRIKNNAKLDDVLEQKTNDCAAEKRDDRRIDYDLATDFIEARLNLK